MGFKPPKRYTGGTKPPGKLVNPTVRPTLPGRNKRPTLPSFARPRPKPKPSRSFRDIKSATPSQASSIMNEPAQKVNLYDRGSEYVGLNNPANKLYSPEDTSIYGADIPNSTKEAEGWFKGDQQLNNAQAASWQSEIAGKAGLPYAGTDMYGTPANNIPSDVAVALGLVGHPSMPTQSGIWTGDADYANDPRYGPGTATYDAYHPSDMSGESAPSVLDRYGLRNNYRGQQQGSDVPNSLMQLLQMFQGGQQQAPVPQEPSAISQLVSPEQRSLPDWLRLVLGGR